jgi:hypothetical protein
VEKIIVKNRNNSSLTVASASDIQAIKRLQTLAAELDRISVPMNHATRVQQEE